MSKDLNDLAKRITLAEGKKESISIAQVKEVLGIVSDALFGEPLWFAVLYQNGRKRLTASIAKTKYIRKQKK